MIRRLCAVLVLVAALLPIASCRRGTAERPPVILIVADALRHDYATLPGYRPDPRGLQRLSATSNVFTKCVTTMPATRGSFPGLFSGEMTGSLDERERRASWIARMRAAGYRTTFIASSVAFGKSPSAVDVGTMFDEAILENTPGRIARPMPEAVTLFDSVLAKRKDDSVLVILHLILPHAPYWRGSYADNVTNLDHHVAAILNVLDRRGIYDRAHVIFTSDHGESLQEHGAPPQHGWNVYGEETRIPMIWKTPGERDQHTISDLVRNYDIGPTVLDLLGMSGNASPSRRSGVPIAAMTGHASQPLVAFHTALSNRMYPVPQMAIRSERYLMIKASEGLPSTELYDYAADPSELYNIASLPSSAAVIHRLEPQLDVLKSMWIDSAVEKRETLSPEMQKTLQSLGYLGTGPSTSRERSPLTFEALPGVHLRFRECISQPWGSDAGERYDSLFPIRIVPAGSDLFIISNSTRDLMRLETTAGRVRPPQTHGAPSSEIWFQRKQYELTSQDGTLLALLDGRKLKKYWVNPNDYRIDPDGVTFGETVAVLNETYSDLLASKLGIVLFANDAVALRHPDGRIETLGHFASDAFRTAVDDVGGMIYVADGQKIFRLRPGQPAELFANVGAPLYSLALRGTELWVGTHPFPSSLTQNNKPIIIYDTRTKKEIGFAGSRLLRESTNFWNNVDVGPFGIVMPRQILFQGERLYVLDSALERVLTFDVF